MNYEEWEGGYTVHLYHGQVVFCNWIERVIHELMIKLSPHCGEVIDLGIQESVVGLSTLEFVRDSSSFEDLQIIRI